MATKLPPVSGTDKPYEPRAQARPEPTNLATYTVEQLLTLRAKIDNLLPVQSLKSINMEQELVTQLAVVKQLQSDTLAGDGVPANQQAQVANAVASALGTLAKLQVELYDSERLKKLEGILVNCLKGLPPDAQELFLTEYEAALGKLGD